MGGFGSDDSAHSLMTAYNLANRKQKNIVSMNSRDYAKSTHVSPLMKGMNINPLDPKIFPCPKSRWVCHAFYFLFFILTMVHETIFIFVVNYFCNFVHLNRFQINL